MPEPALGLISDRDTSMSTRALARSCREWRVSKAYSGKSNFSHSQGPTPVQIDPRSSIRRNVLAHARIHSCKADTIKLGPRSGCDASNAYMNRTESIAFSLGTYLNLPRISHSVGFATALIKAG